ncbi:hypothetical protein LG322_08430 [Microbacterium aerolatum]|uniref:hypothetical protein n=1 Tax=Microbacterium aerolatum TaxID=153731 RepID=UPI00385125A3
MSEKDRAWPYPTISVDGDAIVDEDGDTQTCACGNDSLSFDWRHATQDGRLRWMPDGSSNPAEFAVCPVCGRVYANGDLFEAQHGPVAAVTRYDVNTAAFKTALTQYDRVAYIGTRHRSQ